MVNSKTEDVDSNCGDPSLGCFLSKIGGCDCHSIDIHWEEKQLGEGSNRKQGYFCHLLCFRLFRYVGPDMKGPNFIHCIMGEINAILGQMKLNTRYTSVQRFYKEIPIVV